MITPIKFYGNYTRTNENTIEIPSWVNEPYRRQRQQRMQNIQKQVYSRQIETNKPYKYTRKTSSKNKNSISVKQLAAIGAATLAMAGIVLIPKTTKTNDRKENTTSNIVVEIPAEKSETPKEAQIEITEEKPIETIEEKYNMPDFEINLSDEQKISLENFLNNWYENKEIYEQIENQTNVPKELIAAIHWRESGGNFETYLHNGTKIGETLDTFYGPKVFYSWQDSALDALCNYGGNPDNIIKDDFQSYCDYAEHYNGMGYSKYHNINSPYVWAGTDKYTSGKYTQDGSFDPYTTDRQLGVAVMLKALFEEE